MTRSINPEDLFRLRFLVGATLSPDGTRVVYAQTRVDAEASVEHVDLHLLDVAHGTSVRLTHSDCVNTAPAFSPDGTQVAFLSTRSGRPQLWLLPLAGGEARQVTDLAQGVGGAPVFSPDGTKIAFTAGPPGPPRDPGIPYRVTRTIWRQDGIGLVDDALQDIHILDLTTGDEPRRLTSDGWFNANPKWHPDGESLVYVAAHKPGGTRPDSRLHLITLDGQVTDVTGTDGELTIFMHTVSRDGRVVYVTNYEGGTKAGVRSPLYVVDPATGRREARATDVPGHLIGLMQNDSPSAGFVPGRIILTEDGGSALVQAQSNGAISIIRVPLSGPDEHEVLVSGERVCTPIAAAGGTVLFAAFGFTEPGDFHTVDPDGANERRITRFNEEVLAELTLPVVQRMTFPSKDGAEVEGWFLSPADAEGPVPTVMLIHGGPHAAWGHTFGFEALMFNGAGYGVIEINHRASTGYGDDFATAITGDWGNLDYADLMAGVDHAIELGLADPDRLGVAGISGGGNLTGWIIGHTDRFKAACPENPVFNWISFYGTSDVGAWMGDIELGGPPFELLDTYARCSPLAYALHCTTPTLFLQHENDYRCPAEQTDQFYTALKIIGVPTEMLRFPGSSHGGSVIGPIGHRRAQNDALLDWMSRYVLGKEEVNA
ncbi:S9 family peptidase [Herbidospora sp. RD11066]